MLKTHAPRHEHVTLQLPICTLLIVPGKVSLISLEAVMLRQGSGLCSVPCPAMPTPAPCEIDRLCVKAAQQTPEPKAERGAGDVVWRPLRCKWGGMIAVESCGGWEDFSQDQARSETHGPGDAPRPR